MSDGPWDKLLAQISSPWDWAAASLGAAGGAGATILLHGSDLGTSIAAGATVAVAARKAAAASLTQPQLKRRARGLEEQIQGRIQDLSQPKLTEIAAVVEADHDAWRQGLLSGEQLAQHLIGAREIRNPKTTKAAERVLMYLDMASHQGESAAEKRGPFHEAVSDSLEKLIVSCRDASNVRQLEQLSNLLRELEREQSLWFAHAISNGDFAEQLNHLIAEYRRIASSS